jgi:SOS-response transcriptional repressor LexA
MMGLTDRALELKSFIWVYMLDRLVAPSYDEMAAALGLKSKSGIHRLIGELEARGHLRRVKGPSGRRGYPRAIELLGGIAPTDRPLCHHCGLPFASSACYEAALRNTSRLVREA